jgi:hypothetical protein
MATASQSTSLLESKHEVASARLSVQSEQQRVKLIVTCRRHIVPESQVLARFGIAWPLSATPMSVLTSSLAVKSTTIALAGDEATGTADGGSTALVVRYLMPFNITQVLDYMQKSLGWNSTSRQEFGEVVNEADTLRVVLRNPFVLRMLVQSWPLVSQKVDSSQAKWRSVTRDSIYRAFVQHWLDQSCSLLDSKCCQELIAYGARNGASTLVDSYLLSVQKAAYVMFGHASTTLVLPRLLQKQDQEQIQQNQQGLPLPQQQPTAEAETNTECSVPVPITSLPHRGVVPGTSTVTEEIHTNQDGLRKLSHLRDMQHELMNDPWLNLRQLVTRCANERFDERKAKDGNNIHSVESKNNQAELQNNSSAQARHQLASSQLPIVGQPPQGAGEVKVHLTPSLTITQPRYQPAGTPALQLQTQERQLQKKHPEPPHPEHSLQPKQEQASALKSEIKFKSQEQQLNQQQQQHEANQETNWVVNSPESSSIAESASQRDTNLATLYGPKLQATYAVQSHGGSTYGGILNRHAFVSLQRAKLDQFAKNNPLQWRQHGWTFIHKSILEWLVASLTMRYVDACPSFSSPFVACDIDSDSKCSTPTKHQNQNQNLQSTATCTSEPRTTQDTTNSPENCSTLSNQKEK